MSIEGFDIKPGDTLFCGPDLDADFITVPESGLAYEVVDWNADIHNGNIVIKPLNHDGRLPPLLFFPERSIAPKPTEIDPREGRRVFFNLPNGNQAEIRIL